MRYDKGHKDASRRRILEIAANRFRTDGIAASGIAGIMSEAGLTNGAFYPHFPSKAALVRESVGSALDAQCDQIRHFLAAGGLTAVVDAYLSPEHRDNPVMGCASAALLPEVAREPVETRGLYTERLLSLVAILAAELPAETPDREDAAFGIFATLVGALELARAVDSTELSDRILAAGAHAAKAVLRSTEIPPVEQDQEAADR